jgi:UDP-4-amino-4-deoxy-L-arabinose-oxoglutarate aminotransferase
MRTVPFYRHALGDVDVEAVRGVVNSVFLTAGPRTKEFERALSDFLGVPHAIAVASCTVALFLALKALRIGDGDEVITTPMTFIATANAILHAGATPVFVDVELATGNIDIDRVEQAITKRTRAVIPVHLYGAMVDMVRLHELARARGFRIIEDAAHALEAHRQGVRPGQLSDAACLSFYATKNLTSGEGGAIVVNDPAVSATLMSLRQHGMSKSAAERYTGRYQHWDMMDLGYKANMFDIQAALLLSQLPRLADQLARREEIARRYEKGLSACMNLGFPQVPPDSRSARHLFTIWVPPDKRDDILDGLQRRGIGVAVNYRAIHLLTYYRERFGFKRGDFPIAERIGDSTLTLPLYPSLSDDDVEYVIEAVSDLLG